MTKIRKQKRIVNRLRKVTVLLDNNVNYDMDILKVERPDLLYGLSRLLNISERRISTMKEIVANKIKQLETEQKEKS